MAPAGGYGSTSPGAPRGPATRYTGGGGGSYGYGVTPTVPTLREGGHGWR